MDDGLGVFARAVHLYGGIDAFLGNRGSILLVDLYRVEFSLVQIKLLYGQLLGNRGVWIFNGFAHHFHTDASFFHVRQEYGAVADDPYDLVHDIFLFLLC